VNPRTRQADYVLPTSPDLVAVAAVRAGLVARDAAGEEVQGVMPAYISADHFERRGLAHCGGIEVYLSLCGQ
jgi:hypothetical protein